MDQTSLQGHVQLVDVEPMMRYYLQLRDADALAPQETRNVARALSRSAKDSTRILRQLPAQERAPVLVSVLLKLANHCKQVLSDIGNNLAPRDTPTIGTLLSALEVADPKVGAQLFTDLGFVEATGSAIPCLVKSGAPLTVIERAFKMAPVQHPRLVANMAWAYLERGNEERALQLHQSLFDPPAGVQSFIDNAIIGSASFKAAKTVFNAQKVAPHQASMVRFLRRCYSEEHSIECLLTLYAQYLGLLRGAQESDYKLVTYEVAALACSTATIEDAVHNVERIQDAYRNQPHRIILWNILLTQLSKSWPQAESQIIDLIASYPLANDVVSYRVCLNALGGLAPNKKVEIVKALWLERCSLPQPIERLDRLALEKALGGVSKEVKEELRR